MAVELQSTSFATSIESIDWKPNTDDGTLERLFFSNPLQCKSHRRDKQSFKFTAYLFLLRFRINPAKGRSVCSECESLVGFYYVLYYHYRILVYYACEFITCSFFRFSHIKCIKFYCRAVFISNRATLLRHLCSVT